MNDYTRKLLGKAIDTIESAELLLDNGKTHVAAGRAYYALFYIAEALTRALLAITTWIQKSKWMPSPT